MNDRQTFLLNAVSGELRYWLWKNISLAVGGGHFSLNGYYKDYDDVSKRFPFIRLQVLNTASVYQQEAAQ